MKRVSFSLLCFSFLLVTVVSAQETSPLPELAAPGATLEKLAGDFKFTEGPAVDSAGNVYFTDQPNDRILKWSVDGKLTTFLQPAGRSNGLYFDAEGALWACADEKNQLWKIDVASGEAEVVLEGRDGKLFNGPNDLWIAPDGGVFFTDPLYKRPYWTHRDGEPQLPRALYRLSPDRQLAVADPDVTQPNGIVGTPDGKRLYFADPGAKKTYVCDIAADGKLTNRRLFCEQGSDGMTLDAEGNVYLTGKGVQIFSPAGEKIGQIDVPEKWTANVCFGGADRQTLFITASTGFYALKMKVKGATTAP
ncbi:MAG: SMP-30/gluconolactonase/LRE family protein [Verrucomicrobiae bacterium]|nr:SMP-30/gluconolactonase/LRE family protein [Verrucomicrobiae bacterium]